MPYFVQGDKAACDALSMVTRMCVYVLSMLRICELSFVQVTKLCMVFFPSDKAVCGILSE